MIQINNLKLSFGLKTLYENVTLSVSSQDRIGVVGANGSGKTSLLRIIKGEIQPDSGTVSIKKSITIGYVPQTSKYLENKKVIDEVLSQIDGKESGKIKHKAEKLLCKLGLTTKEMKKSIHELSFGAIMKVILTKTLIQEPDLLLLDEPTNYLDINSIEVFENYLKDLKKTYIIITHDRYFLDRAINKIWSIEDNTIRSYMGNYSKFIIEREQKIKFLKKKYEEQQQFIKKTEDFIQRTKANKKTAQIAKSRGKILEKMKIIKLPHELKDIKFKFPETKKIYGKIVELRGVTLKYNDKEILKNVNLFISGGEKIAIFGANGTGKTTLLKLIAGIKKPTIGYVWLSQKIKLSFYKQGQEETLHPDKTIFEEIYESVPEWKIQNVRDILGNFLFSGDSVYKKIKSLSGGEKARIAIIKSLLKPSNLLLLDEPANHLDIQTRKVLETAIKSYKNTVVFVSHHRHMIDSLADKTIKVENQEIKIYNGNYSYYLEKSKKIPSFEEIDEKQKIREKIKEKERILKEIEKKIEETRKSLNITKARELYFVHKMLKREIEELQLLIKE